MNPIEAIAQAVAELKLAENTTPIPEPIPKPKLVKRQNHPN
ncbi:MULTISPECIES: hypothetical protein [unclassified Tolypothrix]|nr:MULTISPECIES: hypothetical protein [unclassified Tolypothrix]EKF01034.1 hypothetical protein FDUTEX481_08345 [Tolypothrix sp. PCC 7601]BAY90427.1 hypothetical protein NIES3275_24430 [Microchaete diplosiphon NIES-3275]